MKQLGDKNIASMKRHKELKKDFKKMAEEKMPKLKDLIRDIK